MSNIALALDGLAQAVARGAVLEGSSQTARDREQRFARRLIARRKAAVLDAIARHHYRTATARRVDLQAVADLMRTVDDRDSRRRTVRHEAGAILVPLGATTRQRPSQQRAPVFPVHTRRVGAPPAEPMAGYPHPGPAAPLMA